MDAGVRGLSVWYYFEKTWTQESGGWVEERHHSMQLHHEHWSDTTFLKEEKKQYKYLFFAIHVQYNTYIVLILNNGNYDFLL